MPEAKWLSQHFKLPPVSPTEWIVGGPADLLWELLTDPKRSVLYAARICGLARFSKPTDAYELFQQALEERIDFSKHPDVYLALMQHYAPTLPSVSERTTFVRSMLSSYADSGHSPSTQVFNAAAAGLNAQLQLQSRNSEDEESRELQDFVRQMLSEMRHLDIPPSPCVLHCLVTSVPRYKITRMLEVIDAVLTELEKRESIVPTVSFV